MHKIRKIVIFVASPFNERDFKRFGVDILRSNGFEVLVYDFSPLVYPKLYELGVLDPAEYEKHFCFVNKYDAIRAIRELETDVFVILRINYSKQTFWIYKTISKTSIPYMSVFLGSFPQGRLENTDTNHFLNNFFRKVSRLSFKKIINIIYRKGFARYLGIRGANLVVVAGAETLNIYRHSIILEKKTEILYTPSADCNIFLEMGCTNVSNEAKAVYIDAWATGNLRGDHTANEEEIGINLEKYQSSLRNFFNKVEKETGCIVNIAAHPGYEGCRYPDIFGKRLTIVGNTAEMISRSSFVLVNGSTAVSFAILFGKPIIFLTSDDELARFKKLKSKETIGPWLGKTPINIDYPNDLDWDKELEINEDVYRNYKHSFLIANGTEEIISWQIVANRLKQW
jgi:hypothetical protein